MLFSFHIFTINKFFLLPKKGKDLKKKIENVLIDPN